MKLSDLWRNQEFYARDLTEHSRKLAFAVALICWFFKSEKITFPPAVFWSLVFLVGFFIFDVLHYLWGAVRYRRFIYREEERLYKLGGDPEVKVTRKLEKANVRDVLAQIGLSLALFRNATDRVLLSTFGNVSRDEILENHR
jgi:hypothetical protein